VATPEEILNRVLKDNHVKRPLLEASDPMQRIVGLMKQRKQGYGHFVQIVTSERTPDEVVRNLMRIFKAH
jgi:shikimate kinase